MDRQRLLEKIKALMEMAARGTEHEAAIAAEKIQELTLKYQIDLDEIQTTQQASDGAIGTTIATENAARAWLNTLATAIAPVNLCKSFWRKTDAGTELIVVGSEVNVLTCKQVYEYLKGTIERLASEAVKREKAQYRTYIASWDDNWGIPQPEPNWRTWRNNFRQGCCDRVSARLLERFKAAQQHGIKTNEDGTAEQPDISALAVRTAIERSNRNIQKWMRDNGICLQSRATSGYKANPGGYAAGRAAGDRVGLNGQISGGGGNRRALGGR